MAIFNADMENRDIPIKVCGEEKSKTKNVDDKMMARIKVMNAVEDAKKLELKGKIGSHAEECDSARVNTSENEKMSFFSLRNDIMKDLDIFNSKDSQVIRIKDDEEKFEVSLDTSQYRPDELSVNVGEGIISVEGKHEEKSEDGRKMVSRQFSRKYSLPAGAKAKNVVSNLSSDGVLVIAIDKRSIKIRDVYTDEKNKPTQSLETEEISTNDQNIRLTQNERIPTNLRSNFLTDPFFKSNWDKLENVHHKIKSIFPGVSRGEIQKADKSVSSNQTKQENGITQSLCKVQNENKQNKNHLSLDEKFGNYCPPPWMLPALSNNFIFDTFAKMNCDVIIEKDDQNKFELKLDISEYEPEEVKVTVLSDCILVEGSHEERSMEGKPILSRSFTKKYGLPHGVRHEDVISKFTSDQALIIFADQHIEKEIVKENAVDNKSAIEDKQAFDIWNCFEQNYKNTNEDDYLHLDLNEKDYLQSKTNKNVVEDTNQFHGDVKIEQKMDMDSKTFTEHFNMKQENNVKKNDDTIVERKKHEEECDTLNRRAVRINAHLVKPNNGDEIDENQVHRNIKIVQDEEPKILSQNITDKPKIILEKNVDEYDNLNRGPFGVQVHRRVKIEQDIDKEFNVEITDITNDDDEYNKSGLNYRKVNIEQEIENKEIDKKASDNEKEVKSNTLLNSNIFLEANENQAHRNVKIEQDNINEEQSNNNLRNSRKSIEDISKDTKSSGLEFRNVKTAQKIINNEKDKQNSDINAESQSEILPKVIKYGNVAIETNPKMKKIMIGSLDEIKNKSSNEIKSNYREMKTDEYTSYPSGIVQKVNEVEHNIPIMQKLCSGNEYSSTQLKQEEIILSDASMGGDDAFGLTNVKVIHQSTLPEKIIIPQMNMLNEKEQNEECLGTSLPNLGLGQCYPKNWRLPINLSKKLDLFQTEDDQVIRIVDNQEKFEVSLDTSQYRPDELRVSVGKEIITVEGKHEKKSEDGRMMVSRQFFRKYSLPAGAKGESVVSNLSSDGVLLITVTKQSLHTQKEASMHINTEHSRVPITLRCPFLDDPFFKSTWSDIDSIKENMFNESTALWKELRDDSLKTEKSMFSRHQSFIDEIMQSCLDNRSGWMIPRKWMIPSIFNGYFDKNVDLFQIKDSEVFNVKDDKEKFEVSLDTSEYKPDELRVNVGEGIISVVGKHEEKSEDGRKMVSRQFCRKYNLPVGANTESVVSSLSSDGVLVISAPKEIDNMKAQRRVPIQSIIC